MLNGHVRSTAYAKRDNLRYHVNNHVISQLDLFSSKTMPSARPAAPGRCRLPPMQMILNTVLKMSKERVMLLRIFSSHNLGMSSHLLGAIT